MPQPRLHLLCQGHVLLVGKRLCDECKRGTPITKPSDPAPAPRLPTAKLSIQIAEEEDSMMQYIDVYISLNVPHKDGWMHVAHPLSCYSSDDNHQYPTIIEDAEPVDVEAWIEKWRQVAQSYGFSFEIDREVREWVRAEKKIRVEKKSKVSE